jgi:putative sterol carrier protein
VVAFLSQEWLDAQVAALGSVSPAAGASAVVQHVVTGAPGAGKTNILYVTRYDDGRVVSASLGKAEGEPDLTVTATYEDAVRLAKAEVDLSAAYMQGRVKVEGSMPALFSLLPATHTPEFRTAVAAVAAETEA